MSTRPPPRRVDTDPSLWQQESSVRPVQAPPPMPNANSGTSTPSHSYRGQEGLPGMAYGQPQLDRSNSQLAAEPDMGQPREWRNSGWGRGGVAMGHN